MTMDDSPPPRIRYGTFALVALFHIAVIFGLIRSFAPGFVSEVADSVLTTFSVTVVSPPPPPPPASQPDRSGEAAEIGKKAVPKEAAAPKPRVALPKQAAPPVASTGGANAAGAGDSGTGTGAGGQGSGTGSGSSGTGQGGGAATKAVKIAGDINSSRDLPSAGREARQSDFVNVALTVGADGDVKACRIFRASRDAEADRAVCSLAVSRFRFRPAMDRDGNPVQSTFGWQQRYCAGKGDCSKVIR